LITVEDLLLRHGADIISHEYDPVKAREYYLRTRELKGRRKGAGPTTSGLRSRSAQTTAGNRQRIAIPGGQLKRPANALTPQQRKAAIEARVKALKGRLEKLKAALAELVKQAKIRSGADPADVKSKDSKTKPKDTKSKDNKPQTAAEKRAAKERYEKQKKENSTPAKQEEQLRAEIKRVEEKIAKVREELRASLQRAREKAAVTKPAPQRRANSRKDSQNDSDGS
jgi:hypothetical protein